MHLAQESFEEAVRDMEKAFELAPEGSNDARALKNDVQDAKQKLKRSKMKDHYKILGVTSEATEVEIKKVRNRKGRGRGWLAGWRISFMDRGFADYPATPIVEPQAYRKQSLIHHPDKGGSDEKFKEVRARIVGLVPCATFAKSQSDSWPTLHRRSVSHMPSCLIQHGDASLTWESTSLTQRRAWTSRRSGACTAGSVAAAASTWKTCSLAGSEGSVVAAVALEVVGSVAAGSEVAEEAVSSRTGSNKSVPGYVASVIFPFAPLQIQVVYRKSTISRIRTKSKG